MRKNIKKVATGVLIVFSVLMLWTFSHVVTLFGKPEFSQMKEWKK